MSHQLKILFVFLTSIQITNAQNLVVNPSFEIRDSRPSLNWGSTKKDHKNVPLGWDIAVKNTSPDYYKSTTEKKHNLKENPEKIAPFDGSYFVGLHINYSDYSEYVKTKLTEPLVKGKFYEINFHVCLSENSKWSTSQIGMLLSIKGGPYSNMNAIRAEVAQVHNAQSLDKIGTWETICWVYQALGGEEYITIGNFQKMNELRLKVVNTNFKNRQSNLDKNESAYYLLDMVEVIPIDSIKVCKCLEPFVYRQQEVTNLGIPPSPFKAETISLNHILFKTGSYDLGKESSFGELDSLTAYLKKRLSCHVEVLGYTDNIGSAESNQDLSTNRAKTIADYFIQHGIEKNQVTFKGLGATNPLENNSTEYGKSLNRRIELNITD